MQLVTETHGVVALGPGSQTSIAGLNLGFQAFKCTSPAAREEEVLNTLVEDCRKAFTAHEMDVKDEYSSGETFWVGADVAEHKCALEALAKRIFDFHVSNKPCIQTSMHATQGWMGRGACISVCVGVWVRSGV